MSVELIRCSACGAVNRVPDEKVAQGLLPVCGRCHRPLESSAPVTVTDATFTDVVEHAATPVLLDMWAAWCGPCRMLAAVVDELAGELAGRVRVAKLNVDENPQTASRFNVRSIPTLLFIKGGKEIDRIVGVHSKSEIAARVRRAA